MHTPWEDKFDHFFGRPVINSMAVRTPGQFITRVLLNFFLPLHVVPFKTVKPRHIPLKTRNLLTGLKFRIKLAFVFSKSTQMQAKRTTGTCSGQCTGCDSAKIRRGGGFGLLSRSLRISRSGAPPPNPTEIRAAVAAFYKKKGPVCREGEILTAKCFPDPNQGARPSKG